MTEDELRAWLISWVSSRVNPGVGNADVHIDTPLDELGLASRDAVSLAGDLEDHLDRAVSPTIAWESPTIRLLAAQLIDGTDGTDGTDGVASVPSAGTHTGAGTRSDPGAPSSVPASSFAGSADDRVAIIGMGCRLPGGVDSPAAFWELLHSGTDATRTVPADRQAVLGGAGSVDRGGFLASIDQFDAEFFGITPREADLIDPQQRLLLEVAVEAIQHARLDLGALRGTETGVYVGISASEYAHLTTAVLDDIEPWTATGAALSIAANRISYALDLHGPSLSVDTACSSSLVALHQACTGLLAGECDAALVGGVNLILTPVITTSFDRAGALSGDGRCKPFAAQADGIGRGEGCGVVVLKRLADARAAGDRVLAIVAGTAVNSDGRSNGLTAPNPAAQRAVLRRAYRRAGIDPVEVDYVETHGTGTPLGDPIEAGALGDVLGLGRPADRPLLIGSVKSNLGHLEAASGIAGLIKVVLALGAGRLPASLHAGEPNPLIDFAGQHLKLVTEAQAWPLREQVACAGVSAFGFGGTNAHVVLQQAPATAVRGDESGARPPVLVLSADTDERIRLGAAALADWLEVGPGRHDHLGAVARSLRLRCGTGTGTGARSVAVAAADRHDAATLLRAVAGGRPPARNAHRPVWVFSGFGQQWAGMGRQLLQTEPVFAAAVDEVAPLLLDMSGVDVAALLRAGAEPAGVTETMLALFATQIALAALWRSLDVEPAAVIGQSLGEVAAAVVSGGISLADGARVMSVRARLLAGIAESDAGGMALLGVGSVQFETELAPQFPAVSIAVYSGPDQIIVAGDRDQVEALIDRVSLGGGQAWPLRVGGSGHTAAVDSIMTALRTQLAEVRPLRPQVPFYSTVSADPAAEASLDAEYWTANARQPVRLTQAIAAAAAAGFDTFIEISAHPVVARALQATLAESPVVDSVVVGSLRRGVDDAVAFAANVGELHAGGHPSVLAAHRGDTRIEVDLPPGPWRRRSHWFRPSRASVPQPPPHASVDTIELGERVSTSSGMHVWTAPVLPTGRLDLAGVLALATRVGADVQPDATVRSAGFDQPVPADGGSAALITCTPAGGDGRTSVEVFAAAGGAWLRIAHAELEHVVSPGRSVPSDRSPADVSATGRPNATGTVAQEAHVPAAARPSTPADIAHRLRAVLADIMGYDPAALDIDAALVDLGFDSLMATRAQHAVRRDFGVPLPVRLLLQGLSLSGLAAHICTELDVAEVAAPRLAGPALGPIGPRDPAERLLAGLWAYVLGHPPTSVTDTFPPDAADAARLAAAIERRLGRGAPDPKQLLAAGTLERMADLIRADVAGDADSAVRVLHGAGVRRPLFAFHPAGGPTSVYLPLVAQLPADQPVYGMERLDGIDTIEAKASSYVELLRARQPHGPYRLIGWSFGGVLAYEVAQQLQSAGEQVEFLASIDTVLPREDLDGADEATMLTERLQRFAEYLSHTYGAEVHMPAGMARDDVATQMTLVQQALSAAGVTLPAGVLKHQYTSYVDARIAEKYVPKPYAAPMVLYRATDVDVLTTSLDPRYLRSDESAGWAALASNLEIVRVPGDHIAMIDPPNVDVLAEHLRDRLIELDTSSDLAEPVQVRP